MKKFYTALKIFYAIAGLFLLFVIGTAIYFNLIDKNYFNICLCFVAIIYFFMIGFPIYMYYRNIVVEISFFEGQAVIKTNAEVYTLPCDNFYEIVESKLQKRIFIKYKDEKRKKFLFFKNSFFFSVHMI